MSLRILTATVILQRFIFWSCFYYMKFHLICFLSLFILAACTRSFDGGYNMPLLYKIDVQQGNVVDQEMVDKLKPGMDKNQVKFIMGTPVIVDPFHSERWEYVYSFQPGGGVREQRHITVHFVDEKLSHITGDIEVSYAPREEVPIVTEEEAVLVPKSENEEGDGFLESQKNFLEEIIDIITPNSE